MADLPLHPRLAHMLLKAVPLNSGLACGLAALLSERDILRAPPAGATPICDSLDVLHSQYDQAAGATVDRAACQR
jgi:ATP-dependent helicase HrpB